MSTFGFIIGTLAILFASRVISLPLATLLLRRRGGDPNTLLMAVDVAVMGVIGFLLGIFMHSPFIGISLSPRGWPGMISFIAASFIGSRIGLAS